LRAADPVAIGDTLMAMAELALDRGLVSEQAEGGAIEAVPLEA
jgi:hypothetical protein